ncbi:MAG TPA: ATP-binding protein [Acidobacteriaceae bacterium]|jgi:signal transduction histidine kinase|nr:ATP-binding protein [Acidobacteriaceae bacterium]
MDGNQPDPQERNLDLFSGPGEMAGLMRRLDWTSTPLGDPDLWPRSLRVAVRILLGSGYPMYIAWGPAFTQLYNDAYRPILGKTKHPGALGSGSSETFPEIWEFIGPMFRRVMAEGQDTTLIDQALFLDRNGYIEECYYNFSYSPIPDDEIGRVGGVLVTCFEVTDRIIEQRRLQTVRDLASTLQRARTSEEVCSSAIAALRKNQQDLPFAAIYLIDQATAAARLAGVAGASSGDPVAPDPLPLAEDSPWPLRTAFETQAPVRVHDLPTRFAVLPHGAWPVPPTEAVVVPIAGSSRLPAGFFIAGLNPRKEFDERYEQFLVNGSAAIAARLSDVNAYADEKRRAEALAELDRAKTVFFSNISHEFRTPLTLILGPLEELASDESVPAQGREQVLIVQRNALRIQRLVNNLLDFSRIEAGRVQALFEPVDLAALTAELASGFRSTFERAGLFLEVQQPSRDVPVYIDREMWEKIVLNLLSNAFKFTLEGGVTLRLESDEHFFKVTIADTGVGIRPAELPRVFDRFYRVEGSRGRSYEGTGIGLALVQELVRLQGGSITVASTERVGTQFTIALPLGAAHLDPERIGRTPRPSSTASRIDAFVAEAERWAPAPNEEQCPVVAIHPEEEIHAVDAGSWSERPFILVAEDNADMRDYLCRLLKPHFEVEAVRDGRAALDEIRRRRPDLLLTDVMMPGLDGLELLRTLRSDPETASLPVILLSARAGEEAHIEGLQAGADDYLLKPFSARELVARVAASLKIADLRATADRAVRSHEARAREVLTRTTDAVFMLDREWRFSFLNDNAAALIAGGRDLLGRNLWEEFPDAMGREFWRQYHRAMTEGVAVEFQEYYPAPLDKWLEVHAYPTDQGIAVFFRDITARLRSEAALRQQEKLAAAGRLAASIAHEINNPLEAVTNLLYLIEQDQSLKPQTREWLQSATAEISRVSQIATQTLLFHRQSTNPSQIHLREVIESALTLYARRMQDLRIAADRRFRPSISITAFPGELRQVFANLIGNAIDAMPSGGRIQVRERRATQWRTGQPGIVVTIADTGHGMSEETVRHLFQPFFSTKPNTGTGLGLWVSRDIVLKHGGSITVRSSGNPARHGSVFRIFLPSQGVLRPPTNLPDLAMATTK